MSNKKPCRLATEQLETRALLSTIQVVNDNGFGTGSFHWAIHKANLSPGPDTITFNIPGDGVHNIPTAGLFGTPIRGKVLIDGYTQPGSIRNTSPDPLTNNARIQVNLFNATNFGPALAFSGNRASGSEIRGIGFATLERFGTQTGLEVRDADNISVNGCLFGAAKQGRLSAAVIINDSDHVTIGGDPAGGPALQNVLSGYKVGVVMTGASQHNEIVNNRIGFEPELSANPIQKLGVLIRHPSKNNLIARNVFYKNLEAYSIHSPNVIVDNTIIPR